MKSVEKELKEIEQLRLQADAHKKGADENIETANKKMNKLAERIRNGDTTGDRVKDFVLARYGFLSEEIENVYRDIEKRVAKSVSQFVFVYSAWDEHGGCTGFGGKGYYTRACRIYIGILQKAEVSYDFKTGVVFPTKKFVFSGDALGLKTVEKDLAEDLIDNGLWTKADFGLNLTDNPFDLRTDLYLFNREGEKPKELTLKIGDKEIEEWFHARRHTNFIDYYEKMTDMLGRPYGRHTRSSDRKIF